MRCSLSLFVLILTLLILHIIALSVDPEHFFVLLSTPGQASTALSYILAVLPQLHCPSCVLRSCDGVHEALNPRCHSDCEVDWIDDEALGRCMGSQGPPLRENIWLSKCAETDWHAVIETVLRHRITFLKDVFSPSKLPLFVESGFQVLLAFKPPWLTFPTSVSGMYDDIHDQYCLNTLNISRSEQAMATSRSNPGRYTSLASIVWRLSCFQEVLTDTVKGDNMRKKLYFLSRPPPCFWCRAVLAHYISHFHLFTAAVRHHVPIINTYKILSLRKAKLRKYLHTILPAALLRLSPLSSAHIGTTAAKKDTARILDSMINRSLYFRSSRLIRAHSSANIISNTSKMAAIGGGVTLSEQIFATKRTLFANSGCAECLLRLASLCQKEVQGCDDFNIMYGIKEYFDL